MKIKETELDIVQKQASSLKVDAVVDMVFPPEAGEDEDKIRNACVKVLSSLSQMEIQSVALNVSLKDKDCPVVGAAKILAQEILRFCRDVSMVSHITVCLNDKKIFDSFNTTMRGYLDHIKDDLGWGPYVTVDIIIELKEGIVLIERSNPPYGWALPGGFVDYGETLEEAVAREAKEETNMGLVDLRQLHTYSNPDRDPRFHTISTVFVAKGTGTPQFGDDAKGLKIVKYDDLLKYDYAFDHKKVIADYLKKRG